MGGAEESRRVAYETARLRLARYRLEGEQVRARAAAHATQVSAEALAVARVGVWLFRDRGRRLVCVCQYERERHEHTAGQSHSCEQYPTYVDALSKHRVIAAQDARVHPLTRELTDSYLVPLGITSMLDAPIIREGSVIGVVCHEHIGPLRTWGQKDLEFASSVADMVTLIFEQADRLELEAALQEQAEQRQEGQKMEALGRMAAAVAHDFNNLLAAVGFYVNEVGATVAPDLRDVTGDITDMLDVGQRLTQQLLAFGRERSSDGTPTEVDLGAVVERILPMVRAGVGRAIEINVELLASDTRVLGDVSQLEQVVLNLCLNARDAIAEHGEITLVLRDALPGDEVAPDCVVLEVKDSGTGMDEATRVRIFEPFFTTKAQGTGLGLATVYGIVKRSGGVVRALSEPNAGTTMLVALPRVHTG